MEYIIMLITHIFKTVEYFAIEGFPEIPLDALPEAAEAIAFNLLKLTEIYLSMF